MPEPTHTLTVTVPLHLGGDGTTNDRAGRVQAVLHATSVAVMSALRGVPFAGDADVSLVLVAPFPGEESPDA